MVPTSPCKVAVQKGCVKKKHAEQQLKAQLSRGRVPVAFFDHYITVEYFWNSSDKKMTARDQLCSEQEQNAVAKRSVYERRGRKVRFPCT